MKVKCPSCGKKEMELLSKYEIKANKFVSSAVFSTVASLVKDWMVPSKYVCLNCGHMENA